MRTSRPKTLFDEIDIKILHEVKIKSYSALELSQKVRVSPNPLKNHLLKLHKMGLISIQKKKGRELEISIKACLNGGKTSRRCNSEILIISILKKACCPLTISDIHKKMDLSYKNTYVHIQKLKAVGLVSLKKNLGVLGQPVTIELVYSIEWLAQKMGDIVMKAINKGEL